MSAPPTALGQPPGQLPGRWQAFREGPFLPATVVALILAVSAGFFAGSYTHAIADPTPQRVPVAVVAGPGDQAEDFLAALERRLDASLDRRPFPNYPQAVDAIEGQSVFAVVRDAGAAAGWSLTSPARRVPPSPSC